MTIKAIEHNSVKLKDFHSDTLRYVGLFVRECTDVYATYHDCKSILYKQQSAQGLYQRLQEAIDRMCHAIEFSAATHKIESKKEDSMLIETIDLLSGKVSMLECQANNTRRYIAEVEKSVTELNIVIDARLYILEKQSNIK